MVEPIFKRSAGLDVHKKVIVATVLLEQADGSLIEETREFATFLSDLKSLAQWLKSHEIDLTVMESTGIYWKNIYRVLEAHQLKTYVVNARHVKQVPGRKTDVKDSQWLASLARFGLLKGSFIPPKEIEQLRLMTRHRIKLKSALASEVNRLHKLLDDAGVYLSAVVSDIQGVCAQKIINGLIEGESVEQLCSYLYGRLKTKESEIRKALEQSLSEEHLYLMGLCQSHILFLKQQCNDLEEKIFIHMKPYKVYWEILQTVPGFDKLSAAMLIAEIGINMEQFGSAEQFCSWAGMCPGNNESAGKRKSGRTRKGPCVLRRTLCETAQAAARTRSQFQGYHKGLVIRRGYKRAIVAVGHKQLRIIYTLFKNQKGYQDSEINYEELSVKRNAPRWIKALTQYGFLPTAT